MCTKSVSFLKRTEKGTRKPETGVMDDFNLACDCQEQNTGPLREQPFIAVIFSATEFDFKRTCRNVHYKETEIRAKCF